LLEERLIEAQDQGRVRSVVEINVLLALALARFADMPRSRQTLIQALALAQPEGYQRQFLNEGQQPGKILQDTLREIQEEPLANYARALLYASAQEKSAQAAQRSDGTITLIEPLSDQEQRVLRLIAAGRTNPEIVEALVISINTVKTHVKNIYGKVGVKSREEAREAARHLRLQ